MQNLALSAAAPNSNSNVSPSRGAKIGGYILSGLPVAFLLMDATMKLVASQPAVEGTQKLGYDPAVLLPLGVTQLVCLITYLLPRTAVLGAILWTGYLGGAVATHVRMGDPWFSHILFPVYIGAMLWLGLWLRSPALRALVPLRRG
ncbi:MAG: DoxX family protein [Polyangiaceae bacterium]|nr:DoxX family protein [Myxococcales bacterium]MCB9584894.1 DoxX family protein [Polyangiaceae bacterium]MCB9607533.1 DoxX family protein [Polyangiaceae bacterium]